MFVTDMTYTQTRTQSSTVTITEARVREVLRQVNVDMLAAVLCKFVSKESTDKWKDDLFYMLGKNALRYFELRVYLNGDIKAAWRYEVSIDGSLTNSDRGGGINFYSFSNGSTVKLIIQRRENLPSQVNEEINRRGWTSSVQALTSGQTAERSYSKDGYGVIRHRLILE
jgi:hypothetical protein